MWLTPRILSNIGQRWWTWFSSPHFVNGRDPELVHHFLKEVLDQQWSIGFWLLVKEDPVLGCVATTFHVVASDRSAAIWSRCLPEKLHRVCQYVNCRWCLRCSRYTWKVNRRHQLLTKRLYEHQVSASTVEMPRKRLRKSHSSTVWKRCFWQSCFIIEALRDNKAAYFLFFLQFLNTLKVRLMALSLKIF